MTKELITEEYSYFNTVFGGVRTKKRTATEDIRRVKVTKDPAIQADKLPVRFYCFWPAFV